MECPGFAINRPRMSFLVAKSLKVWSEDKEFLDSKIFGNQRFRTFAILTEEVLGGPLLTIRDPLKCVFLEIEIIKQFLLG